MAYDCKTINEFGIASDDWKDNYVCDIRELKMPYGIYEVFKYCFKDIDIKNIKIFIYLFFGLRYKRIRQGCGQLYNLKIDYKDLNYNNENAEDISNYLEFKDELPVEVHNRFRDMIEKYGGYRKISIFKKSNIKDNLL